jgi:hypothetical protein
MISAGTAQSGRGGPGNFLARYWRGEGPLWRIYWLYGVLGSLVLSAIFAAALVGKAFAVQQVLLPIVLAFTAWIVVAVWRCAPNTRKELYTHLARGLTVAWALNVVMLIGFLQLELVAVYAG